ncbi:multidrug ABC transporter permease [Chryseobacterium lactis]|uniref:ABC transporter permease n=1 Tax=Chryseobacterium lactis TaxID=1241981 RepID=A0A3G6RGC6_CHRLC|nr:ABC transporter permease [Chryseobacterium lactis]AZA83706.1 ABC transporter permease [Chryseobacterium lactis]AZB04091.1 ABC transporter permease [Chryseobacterium lactis]PNW13001.1 multidrug ABC transporter permease [Chryseobacterium lactis]
MKQLLVFIRKEFYHVFRDRRTLLILFGLPVVQIILFGYALSSEVKNIGIAVLDNAHDVQSEQIISKIKSSPYFEMQKPVLNYPDIEKKFREGSIKCAVVFPVNFGSDLYNSKGASIQIIADASDPNTATILTNYLNAMISDYQQQLNPALKPSYQIIPEVRQLFNEEQNGSLNFIPGVIALIFMIVSTALTSVAVVREKEMGTMEILLVSPFKPVMVLIAKAIPYLVLSLVNFIIILLLSVYLLNVEIRGSLILLFAESILFIITCLSLGLLISNLTNSQQTAMLISMMGMMLPTLLLTGFMFPIENMPWIFQVISRILPSRYYYDIVKSVMLKGLGFSYVWKETLVLLAMSAGLLTLALKKFKIRLS